eukprot:1962023-Ditylum_brightwellii.AAC.2
MCGGNDHKGQSTKQCKFYGCAMASKKVHLLPTEEGSPSEPDKSIIENTSSSNSSSKKQQQEEAAKESCYYSTAV